MNAMPEFRAVLGVDAVGSASLPAYLHGALHRTIGDAVDTGLALRGVSAADVIEREDTGDGLLITVPSTAAGALLDAAQSIEFLLASHNSRHKPDVHLRMAVELGPVAEGRGFASTKSALARMLDAEAFRDLFRSCVAERPALAVNSALVISEQVMRTVVNGGHTCIVRGAEFAGIRLANKEYDETAWVRVPSCDPDTLTRLANCRPAEEAESHQVPSVVNISNGGMHGVQAGVVNGGVFLGGSR